MGFIRGGLVVIVSVLLFLSFLAGSLFLTMDLSLDYDTIRPELVSVVKDIYEYSADMNQAIEDRLPFMQVYCENNSEFVFSEQGYTFAIPCNIVMQGSEVINEEGVNSLVEDVYYKEYNCEFWKCFNFDSPEPPFFLVSKKAQDYWHSKFYFSLLISVALIALLFFLVEYKTNWPIIVGSLLTVSSLPFMKLNWLLSFGSNESVMKLFASFFTKSYNVFLVTFIIGIIILALGIILKFFKVGFKISEIFSKREKPASKEDIKKIVKKEVSNSKKGEIGIST